MQDSSTSGKKPIKEVEELRARKAKLERVNSSTTERKKAEEELKQSKEFLANVINALDDPVFVKDEQHRWVVLNDAACKVMGRSREELIGRSDYDLFSKQQAAVFWERDDFVLKNGQTDVSEEEITWHGKLHTISTKKSVFTDSVTGKKFIAGTIRDITERKKAEEELEAGKKKLETYIESMVDGVAVADLQNRLVQANKALAELLGYDSVNEMLGMNTADLVPKREISRIMEAGKECIKKGTLRNFETIALRKDGWEVPVQLNATALKDPSGKLVGNMSVIRDITERKKTEEALRKSEEKYRTLYETTRDGIAGGPMDGRVLECNQAFADMLGYSREELSHLTYQQLTPKRWHQMEAEIVEKQILKRGYSDEYEKEYIRKDGTVFPISARVWLVRDKEGKPIGMWGIVRDISVRKRAEQLLRKERDKAQKYLDVAGVMLVVIDVEERVGLVNKKGCEILGYKEEEIIGKNWFDNFLPQRIKRQVKGVFEKLVGPEADAPEYYENLILTKDGDERLMAWHNTVLRDDKGEVIATLGSGEDITERKKAEEEIKIFLSGIEDASDGFAFTKMNGDVIYANEAAANIFGYSLAKMMKLNIAVFSAYPEDAKHLEEAIAKQGKWRGEITGIRKNKEKFPAILSVSIVKDEKGKPIGRMGIFRDITERKRAEEELRLERDNFTNILDSMEDGVYIVGQNYDIQYVNPAIKKEFGQFEGRKCYEYFHDRKEVCSWCKNEEVFAGKTVRWEWYSFKNQRTYDLIDTPLRNPDGSISKLEIFRDITERKQAEERIREQSEFLRNTIESLSHPFYVIDANDYTIKMANTAAGGAEALPEGITCYALTHRLDKPCASSGRLCPVEKIKKTKKPAIVEHTHYDKDGEKRIFEIHAYPIFDGAGNVSQVIEYSLDITERKRAEEALRRSQEDWENTFNAISDWVVLMDLKGRILRTNRAGEEFVGVPMAQMAGQTCCKLLHGSDTPLPGCPLLKMLRTGRSETMELQLPDSNRWLAISVDPVIDENGTLAGAVHIARDITERKHAEQERESTISLLHLLNTNNHIHELMKVTMVFLKDWSDCEAVGIRFQDGDDFPYFETSGFPEEFVLAENKLCSVNEAGKLVRDSQGRPYLECMCGNVISGRFDPSKYFFTEHGSFWVNSTTQLLAGTTETDRLARTRNRCNTAGYESVALIPLRAGKETFGLLQFNDKQKGRFTPEKISLLERLADNLAIGLAQRRAEQALRESQQSLVRAQQIAHIGDWDRDFVENTVKWSEELYRIFGVSPDDFEPTYKGFLSLVHPDDRELVSKITTNAASGKQPFSVDYRIVRPDGTQCAVHSQGEVHTNNNGRVSRNCGTVQDITERKKAEEAYRSLVDHSLQGLAIFQDGRVVFANQAVAEITGYTVDEMLSSPTEQVQAFVHPEDRALVWSRHRDRLDGKPLPDRYEFRGIRKDGSTCWLELHASLVEYQGRPAIQAAYVDITERKQAEETLKNSEQKYKGLIETAIDGYIMTNMQGKILDCNKAYLDMIGYTMEEAKKLSYPDITPSKWHKMEEEIIKSQFIKRGYSDVYEKEYIRKDGTVFPISIRGRLIKDEKGQAIGMWGFVTDITERKQAEQKLLDDQAQLKSLASQLTLAEERERRRIASELHDQISQSLVISKMKLESLCKSGYSKELDKALDEVCNSLGQTIADTRSLTFDLSPPILYELGFEAAVAEWLTGQIRDKHDIKTEFEDDGQPRPLDDDIRVLLFRNVRELLINVVKHANAKNVKVSIRKVGKQIRVSVEDDGGGFDPDKVASMAVKRAEFGLFSIRERLEESGGHLEIESELSHGSRITMFAPLKGNQKTKRNQK